MELVPPVVTVKFKDDGMGVPLITAKIVVEEPEVFPVNNASKTPFPFGEMIPIVPVEVPSTALNEILETAAGNGFPFESKHVILRVTALPAERVLELAVKE